jgi:hypothetical protein
MQKPVLKQYDDLTEQDLASDPVWVCVHGVDEKQPWYGETNELTYRPWGGPPPYERAEPAFARALARTDFTLADGSALVGLITLPVAAEADERAPNRLQPSMFLPDGTPADFYRATQSLAEETVQRFLRGLRKTRSQVFPIRYEVSDRIALPAVHGELAGVYYLRNLRPREFGVL